MSNLRTLFTEAATKAFNSGVVAGMNRAGRQNAEIMQEVLIKEHVDKALLSIDRDNMLGYKLTCQEVDLLYKHFVAEGDFASVGSGPSEVYLMDVFVDLNRAKAAADVYGAQMQVLRERDKSQRALHTSHVRNLQARIDDLSDALAAARRRVGVNP